MPFMALAEKIHRGSRSFFFMRQLARSANVASHSALPAVRGAMTNTLALMSVCLSPLPVDISASDFRNRFLWPFVYRRASNLVKLFLLRKRLGWALFVALGGPVVICSTGL